MSIFYKITNFFKGLFSKVEKWIDEIGEPVIHFLEQVKSAVDNPALDVLVRLTATPIDDLILHFLRAKLPFVIEQLGVLNDFDGSDEDIRKFVEHLKNMPEAYREAMYSKTASLLAEQYLNSGQKVPNVRRFETDTLAQLSFDKVKKDK